RLDAANILADHDAGQKRVFSGIFISSAVMRIAHEVDAAGQEHVEALAARLIAGHGAGIEGERGVPARGERQPRRQRRRLVAAARIPRIGDAETAVVDMQRGQAKPRDRRYVADIVIGSAGWWVPRIAMSAPATDVL